MKCCYIQSNYFHLGLPENDRISKMHVKFESVKTVCKISLMKQDSIINLFLLLLVLILCTLNTNTVLENLEIYQKYIFRRNELMIIEY